MSARGEKFDVIVVGAGPAGLAASYTLATAGVKVALIERGDFPGSKNVMGGVLYRQPTEEIFGEGFWKEAPVERHVIETQAWVLTENSVFKAAHRHTAFDAGALQLVHRAARQVRQVGGAEGAGGGRADHHRDAGGEPDPRTASRWSGCAPAGRTAISTRTW